MDDSLSNGSLSRPVVPQRTYGRSRVAVENDTPLSAILLAPPPLPSATTSTSQLASSSTTLLERFSARSTNWRESLVELDASHNELESEDDIQAARERFRKGGASSKSCTTILGPSSKQALTAFSSSTLTDPPSSTPRNEQDIVPSSSPTSRAPSKSPLPSCSSPQLKSAEIDAQDNAALGTPPAQPSHSPVLRDASPPPSSNDHHIDEDPDSLDDDHSSTPQLPARHIKVSNHTTTPTDVVGPQQERSRPRSP